MEDPMRRPAPLDLALRGTYVVALFTVVGCGEETPTQPSSLADGSATPSLAITSGGNWSSIAPMPCCDGSGVSVGAVPNSAGQSIAYVFGGTNANGHTGSPVRAYNVATNTWSVKTAEIAAFDGNGVGVIGGKLYLTGGYAEHDAIESTSPFLWVYDPATDVLTQKANPPLRTAEGVTGVIGDRLYVLPGRCAAIGIVAEGWCNQDEFIRKLFRYNPATNIWVIKASAPHYHKNGAGGAINNKFYVVGGNKDFDPPTRALDVYDPATNTWKTLAPLPTALQGLTGTVLRGLLFVTGGTGFGGSGTRWMYAYNPTTNKWIVKTPPPAGIGARGNAAAKVILNGTSRMVVVSGPVVDGPSTSGMYTP
jgi:N-acetylneuraminic acid mutarotase